jgi:iron-sulfur cluster assembly protein
MAVTLSSSALARVREYQAQTPGAIGLRFGVKKSGCSGWAYVIDMAQTRKADDVIFQQEGVEVLVDPDSLPQVDGTEIDFVSQGLNQQFIFKNPRVAGECGCGESFTTEESAA